MSSPFFRATRIASLLFVTLLSGAITACASKTTSSRTSTTSATSSSTTISPDVSSEAVAIADLTIDGDGHVTQTTSNELRLGTGQALARQMEVAFARPEFSASCIRSAHLRMYLLHDDGSSDVEFPAYASRQFQMTNLHDGEDLGAETILSNRPRGTTTISTQPGWSDWDVTDIARRWLDGKPMDGSAIPPPQDAPIVLTLIPTVDAANFTRTFSAVEGQADRRPRLSLNLDSGCK